MSEYVNNLTKEEMDVLGEIGNISLGNAATTLSVMVNQRVEITTPVVDIKGLSGNNVFILKEPDVLCMTDLMMGGDGTNTQGEVTELHLSAASEAMNQMMGTSATSMAQMLQIPVDISTPDLSRIDVESVKQFEKMFESNLDKFVKIAFRMVIGDLIDSTMVQLYPVSFAHEMCRQFEDNEENQKLRRELAAKRAEQ